MPTPTESLASVLVVDDEPDFASALVLRLRKRGFAAEAVFSGRDAIAKVAQASYDVVVLDLKMPGLDGLRTWQRLRELDPALQCIVLTGHGNATAGIRGMEPGAADFLQKPTDIEMLGTVIRAAAERAHEARRDRGSHGG